MPRSAASKAALKAGHPKAFDDRPPWLQAVDGMGEYDWARKAWANAAKVEGAWFDHALADAIVEDWPNWATLTVDRFAGVKFRLNQWQDIAVRLLVGWMIPIEITDAETLKEITVHVRLFRRLMLWIPRKNGKSEFLAALAILFFVIDGVPQGEGYVFARKERQARIVFNRMAAMIANNPEFKSEVITYAKSFYVKALAAKFELLTGSDAGLHGPSPTVIVGDEMHEWKSLVISDTLRQGTGGRLQPIELYASTAGIKNNGLSVGEQLFEEGRQIIDGRKADPSTLVIIFAANDDDDSGSELTWRKANPSLGLSPTMHFLRQEYAKAKGNPRALAAFGCYHLGIWAESAVRWIPLKKWDACTADKASWKTMPAALKGRPCFLAFDVSSTTDFTALVMLFPPFEADTKWRIVCRFWIPKDRVEARRNEGAPVDGFLDQGALETTDGDYVDQNEVGSAVIQACRDYDVQLIGFDPWNAAKLVGDLQDHHNIEVEKFQAVRQGIQSLGEASKHFERLVFGGQLDHGGHPVLRWMAGHVVVRFDDNLNFMPAKKRSPEKIDGIVAAVMAVAGAFAEAEPEKQFQLIVL